MALPLIYLDLIYDALEMLKNHVFLQIESTLNSLNILNLNV